VRVEWRITARKRAPNPPYRLFRRLLEHEHLVAGLEIDDPAVLDYPGQMPAALQHGDVRERVLALHNDVGELAGGHFPYRSLQADRIGIVAGGRTIACMGV